MDTRAYSNEMLMKHALLIEAKNTSY